MIPIVPITPILELLEGVAMLAGMMTLLLVLASGGDAVGKPSAGEALEMLRAGNARFVSGKLEHPRCDGARLKLAGSSDQAKYAYATVLTCSDSRVPPEFIFDAGVMDLFVVRVAGNVCNTDEIGSVEYGVMHVKTPVLVLLGHTQCGAVTAVTHGVQGEGHELERNIPPLVASIEPAVKAAMTAHPDAKGEDLIPFAIEQNVWRGIENLFMASPSLREQVKTGKLKLAPALYDVGTGKVSWLPEKTVKEILKKVEKNPGRSKMPMAE